MNYLSKFLYPSYFFFFFFLPRVAPPLVIVQVNRVLPSWQDVPLSACRLTNPSWGSFCWLQRNLWGRETCSKMDLDFDSRWFLHELCPGFLCPGWEIWSGLTGESSELARQGPLSSEIWVLRSVTLLLLVDFPRKPEKPYRMAPLWTQVDGPAPSPALLRELQVASLPCLAGWCVTLSASVTRPRGWASTSKATFLRLGIKWPKTLWTPFSCASCLHSESPFSMACQRCWYKSEGSFTCRPWASRGAIW